MIISITGMLIEKTKLYKFFETKLPDICEIIIINIPAKKIFVL